VCIHCPCSKIVIYRIGYRAHTNTFIRIGRNSPDIWTVPFADELDEDCKGTFPLLIVHLQKDTVLYVLQVFVPVLHVFQWVLCCVLFVLCCKVSLVLKVFGSVLHVFNPVLYVFVSVLRVFGPVLNVFVPVLQVFNTVLCHAVCICYCPVCI